MRRPRGRLDGRHARSARTREGILRALLELLDEGEADPTARQIAERAGVALRSIAQHFQTREQLLLALAARHAARLPAVRVDPSRPLSARLREFARLRAQVLEETAPIRRVATRAAPSSRPVAAGLRTVARQRRAELTAAFRPELARAAPWEREAAEAVSSGAFWDQLRQQGASVDATRDTVERLLGRLLPSRREVPMSGAAATRGAGRARRDHRG